MTLVLTEVSKVGIVMAADSAITFRIDSKGRPIEKEQKLWDKLIEVPKIRAAVSYWGVIGAVNHHFESWLKKVISTGEQDAAYNDLDSFADYLARALNLACKSKPLGNKQYVGVHVAGYVNWLDGERRPAFYHVHNGHLQIKPNVEVITVNGQEYIKAVHPEIIADPRKLFEKHKDFPKESRSLEENLAVLDNGYITRNGDYFIYAVLARQIDRALAYINRIPGVSIPRKPQDINSRKGYIHVILQTMVNLYACSSIGPIIGGVSIP